MLDVQKTGMLGVAVIAGKCGNKEGRRYEPAYSGPESHANAAS